MHTNETLFCLNFEQRVEREKGGLNIKHWIYDQVQYHASEGSHPRVNLKDWHYCISPQPLKAVSRKVEPHVKPIFL